MGFDGAKDFSEGMAPVKSGRLWGYVDLIGKMIITPSFRDAFQFKDNIAIIDVRDEYTYQNLLDSSTKVASFLLSERETLDETRAAFIIPSSYEYASVMLGIWQAGGIAVPLCVSHPDPEIDYVHKDSGAEIVIAHHDFEDRIECKS